MKVSIIVPVYNVEPYIEDCLKSVGMQQYDGEIECIVVDDCGTDKSIDIARRYVKDYNGNVRFKIVAHEYNRGLSAARNTGIENSSGDYVYFLDSDDEMLPGAIATLVEPLRGKLYDLVVGEYIVNSTKKKYPHLRLSNGAISDILGSYLRGEWYMMAWNKLINKGFLMSNSLFFEEGLIHEDELWSFLLAVRVNSMYVTNTRTYNYKIRENSITTGGNPVDRLYACARIYLKMVEELSANKDLQIMVVNDFVQSRLGVWLGGNEDPTLNTARKKVYYELRERLFFDRIGLIKCNAVRPRHLLRDLHLFLPKALGWVLFNMVRS